MMNQAPGQEEQIKTGTLPSLPLPRERGGSLSRKEREA